MATRCWSRPTRPVTCGAVPSQRPTRASGQGGGCGIQMCPSYELITSCHSFPPLYSRSHSTHVHCGLHRENPFIAQAAASSNPNYQRRRIWEAFAMIRSPSDPLYLKDLDGDAFFFKGEHPNRRTIWTLEPPEVLEAGALPFPPYLHPVWGAAPPRTPGLISRGLEFFILH